MRTLDSILSTHFNNLGLESLDGDLAATQSNIKNIYNPGVFNSLRRRLTALFGPRIASQFQVNNVVNKKTAQFLDQQSYLTVGDVTVYVPQGLSVTYLQYIEALESAFTDLRDIEAELLRPALNTILALMNNPQMLSSASGIQGMFNGRLFSANLSGRIAHIAECKSQGNKSDTMKYSKAFERNADLEAAVVRQLALQDGVIQVNPDKVKKLTSEIFDAGSKLADLMKTDPAFADVSKSNSKLLAEQLFEVARWVEFLGVYTNEVIISSHAIGDTIKKLDKIAKA